MPASSLDSLIVSPTDYERYNGHHSLATLEFPRPVNDTSSLHLDPRSSPHDVSRWLAGPSSVSNESGASMKLLLIQTRNQSTAKKAPSLSSIPAAFLPGSPQPQTLERCRHTEFIKDIFSELGPPLAAFGAYIKAHITFVCVPANHYANADGTNPSTICAKYYCSGTSWAIAWSHNISTRHTAAVMFFREGDGELRKDEVVADLLRLQTHLSHPMLLGYIKTKVSLSFTFDMLDDMNRETLALEQEIGSQPGTGCWIGRSLEGEFLKLKIRPLKGSMSFPGSSLIFGSVSRPFNSKSSLFRGVTTTIELVWIPPSRHSIPHFVNATSWTIS